MHAQNQVETAQDVIMVAPGAWFVNSYPNNYPPVLHICARRTEFRVG